MNLAGSFNGEDIHVTFFNGVSKTCFSEFGLALCNGEDTPTELGCVLCRVVSKT